MMASYDWRVRHAGLMAIAAIGEGTGKVGESLLSSSNFSLTSRLGHAKGTGEGRRVSTPSINDEDLIILSYSLVVPMFLDSHPRVRYAACQCV